MTNEISGRSNPMPNIRLEEDYTPFNSEEFLRELAADLNDEDSQDDFYGFNSSSRIPDVDRIPVAVRRIRYTEQQCSTRPTLSNKSMLKGLIEKTEHYNKTVDRRVMTDARIAFEEEQLKSGRGQNMMTDDVEVLALSSQNVPKRGRGDYFGKMRSAATDSITPPRESTSSISNNNNFGFFKTNNRSFNFTIPSDKPKESPRFEISERDSRSLNFKPPRRFGSGLTGAHSEQPIARHHFNPETAYNGTITPDFRFNYTPQSAFACPHVVPVKPVYPGVLQPTQPASISSIRLGQRYPKRPDNNPQVPSVPKHLNHNYYNIELYGAAQDERMAQRIEKTVRQTEAPPRRF